ncbi:MAG: hypothetical protein PHW52_04945 [Candidatus Pacebacteria bacterium]|nr:hypothetical protein [Candidatus Paceibacterota bacterium]
MVWKFELYPEEIILSERTIRQASDVIEEWLDHFPWEDTWVENNYGVPSIIIRLDCTVDEKGGLHVYEVEDRPSGIGATSRFNISFKEKLDDLRSVWPRFESIVSPHRDYCDDCEWLPPYNGNGSLVLIRSEPYEKDFHSFQRRSVSTVLTKGNKSYGVPMGLWRKIYPNELEDLENRIWEKCFALKPLQGSKCNNVMIWHPEHRKYRKMFKDGSGTTTRQRIIQTLHELKEMYIQDYIPPMLIHYQGEKRMIYRIFFGYDPRINKYQYIGGFSNVRPSLKIHGATNTLFGSIN